MEKIPDFTKLHWQLNVAILGAVFSVFSLIYNDKYIYYGFITFVYGIIGTSLLPTIENLSPSQGKINYLIIQSIFTAIWIVICLLIGKT